MAPRASHSPVHDITPAEPPVTGSARLVETVAALVRARGGITPGIGSKLTYVRTERFELSNAGAQTGVSYACEHSVTVAKSGRLPVGPKTIAGIAALLALAGAAIGIGLREALPRRPQSVTILLNPPTVPVSVAPAAALPAARPAPIATIPAPMLPVARQPSDQPASVADSRTTAPRPVEATAAINAALATAFATNEMQNWEAGDKSGVVVVGPATLNAGAACRDVAILTRSDGAKDSTVNTRRCQSHNGRIVAAREQPAPEATQPALSAPPRLAYDLGATNPQ